MSKALIPHPDKAQGVLDEAKSQTKGFLIGAATVAVAVPFLGWFIGVGVGAVAVVGWSWKSARRRQK